jgi:S-adenosylmethionine-diacylgycerolhomoserine-N-methlytransferase
MASSPGGNGADGAAHAAHMDGIYRYQRYVYDLTRKFYLLGRDRMIAGLAVPTGGTVLEVGCGTGRNLIQTARRYPNARLYGFDISRMMLETAAANVARAGLSTRITLAEGDASAFSAAALFGVPAFDRVYISYAVSMIPPWRAAVAQGYAAVAPGGSLHIVDFSQQADLPGWFKRGLHAWLAKFSVEPRADLEAELRALAARTPGASLTFEHLTRDYAQLAVVTKPS